MQNEYNTLRTKIKNITSKNFESIALEVFQYQVQNNLLYQQFVQLLGIDKTTVHRLEQIPFLPISFFKHHAIKTKNWSTQKVFKSSGTSQGTPSLHHVASLDWYQYFAIQSFEKAYENLNDIVILGLLPSYLERGDSSLIYMVEQFIQKSKHSESNFFLHNFEQLQQVLLDCQQQQKKVLLIGVTYALLDFAEAYPMPLKNTVVMETGGMKGRRKEMTKPQIHRILQKAFSLDTIHSEYGMTELLSQAYSQENGIFSPSPTLRVLIREINDPFHFLPLYQTGGINIVDLVNLDTCSFIATDDLGRMHSPYQFEILGRLTASDWRGCNLLVGE